MKPNISESAVFVDHRDYSLDTIKALATICVVFVHASNLYGYSGSESLLVFKIYNFFGKFAGLGVPLFFMVSGYLASMQYQQGIVWYKDNLKKKTKALAVPYLIWILIYFLLERGLLGGEELNGVGGVLYDLLGIPFVKSPIYGLLWFVRDLYLLTILLPFLKRITRSFAPILIACALLWVLLEPGVFYIFRSCLWYLFGMLCQTYSTMIEKVCFAVNYHLGLAVLGEGMLLILSILWPKFWLNQIVIAIGVILVWHTFRSPSGRDSRFLAQMRQRIFPASFSIFAIHGKVLTAMQIICAKCFGVGNAFLLAGYFILPILVIAVCIAIDTLLRKTPVYIILTGNRI